MTTRRSGWICAFCFALVSGLAEQKPAPPAPAPLGSANREMTLDVVVTDKAGRPVPGLQPQDFTLLDNGLPLRIQRFQAVGDAAAADPPVEVVLVVDEVNAAFGAVAVARKQIEKFLRREDGDLARPMSMMFFGDSRAIVNDNSSRDRSVLLADLDRNAAALRRIDRSQGNYGASDRLELSLRVFKQLADYEAPRPGRKLVLWISPGWPLLMGPNVVLNSTSQQRLFKNIVSVSDGMRRARMTLFAVDPLGLLDAGGARTSDYKSFLKAPKTVEHAQVGNLALPVLAYQSGGRVLNSSNDVAGEIAACVAEANAFYVLSFERPAADGPDEYHALEVKISRPGLTARTRSGYYAQPERR